MTQHQYPDSKVHGANMGPIWGQQDPGGPHVGPMNFAIWVYAFVKGTSHYRIFTHIKIQHVKNFQNWTHNNHYMPQI